MSSCSRTGERRLVICRRGPLGDHESELQSSCAQTLPLKITVRSLPPDDIRNTKEIIAIIPDVYSPGPGFIHNIETVNTSADVKATQKDNLIPDGTIKYPTKPTMLSIENT